MGKYVIYARKSTESEDRQVLSIDSQIREVRQLAARHGVNVAEVLTESRSAKAPGRPVFGQLVRRIQRGDIAGVLCWKMDRLARNPYDSGLILQAQADGRLERIITSDGVKTANGNDRLMGTFELAFATKYIDDLRANVKRGNRARFEKGWPNHLPPIGYLNDTATKTVVKDPERFELVRRMWDVLLSGGRPKEIARTASREWGLTTPRRGRVGGNPITYSSIYKTFRNPYYAGFIRLKDGRRYLGAHGPMVTPQEFERAQRILETRARAGPVSHENIFAGFIRCGNCGCSVVAEFHWKKGRKYTYHRCCRSKPRVICREKPISEPILRCQVSEYLCRLAIPEPILTFLRDRLARLDLRTSGTSALLKEQREKALRTLEREERELLGLRMRQLIDDAEFNRERETLGARRRDLEDSAVAQDEAVDGRQARADRFARLLNLTQGGPLVVQHGTPVQLRSLLQELQLKIILRGRRLDFTVLEPLSQLVRAGSDSNWCATWIDIWKWIQFGDQAEALGISPAQLHLMMGGDERAVKMVERARRRASGGQPPSEEAPPPRQKRFPAGERLDAQIAA